MLGANKASEAPDCVIVHQGDGMLILNLLEARMLRDWLSLALPSEETSPLEPTPVPASTADQASAPRAGSAVAGGGSESDSDGPCTHPRGTNWTRGDGQKGFCPDCDTQFPENGTTEKK